MLVARQSYPRMIERGVDQTLTLDVFNADGAQQTATAGTVTITAGSAVVVAAAAVTSLGPPVSYTLTAATTATLSLSDRWLEVWALTIGGVVYTFTRAAYLVRRVLYPVITDTDLTPRYADVVVLNGGAVLSEKREEAWAIIQRDLIRRGRRPELVLDAWALSDVHIHQTLALFFAELALSVGDGRYADRERFHRERYAEEWDRLTFRYDADTDGVVDEGEAVSGTPVLWLSAPVYW